MSAISRLAPWRMRVASPCGAWRKRPAAPARSIWRIRRATTGAIRKFSLRNVASVSPMRSLLRGMIAVCGIGRPSGWRNSAVTANQSASPPTIPASANALTQREPRISAARAARAAMKIAAITTSKPVAAAFIPAAPCWAALKRDQGRGRGSSRLTLGRQRSRMSLGRKRLRIGDAARHCRSTCRACARTSVSTSIAMLKLAGTISSVSTVEKISPPMTVTPIGAAERAVAGQRQRHRHHARDHRHGGHHDRLRALVPGLGDRLVLGHAMVHHLDREIDQQDAVLGDDAEQHQQADEHRQRDRIAGDRTARSPAPSGASSSEPMLTNGTSTRL